MIKNKTLGVLEKAINYTLSLDESRSAQIKAMEGKVLKIIIEPFDSHFFIRCSDSQLILDAEYLNPPDATICSSPIGFFQLSLLPAAKARSLFNDSVKIVGNVEFGQNIKKLFDELDIDWEKYLAQFTGDLIASQLGAAVRKGINFQKKLHVSLEQNLSEFLQEESGIFPSKEEITDFFQDVDNLALDLERLATQIQLLRVPHERT